MKRLALSAILIMCSALAVAQPGQGRGMRNAAQDRPCLNGDPQTCYRLPTTAAQGTISQAEIDSLYYMREEEKLAHDVYRYLYQKWQYPIFSNIAESEWQHTQTIAALLARYQLDDPAVNLAAGQYKHPELQKLYNRLIAEGSESLQKALVVGATIEDLDIYDLQKAQSQIKQPDILFAFQNLARGSRNHLRSFYRMLQRNGGQYQPQYISADQFQQIISSRNERGR